MSCRVSSVKLFAKNEKEAGYYHIIMKLEPIVLGELKSSRREILFIVAGPAFKKLHRVILFGPFNSFTCFGFGKELDILLKMF